MDSRNSVVNSSVEMRVDSRSLDRIESASVVDFHEDVASGRTPSRVSELADCVTDRRLRLLVDGIQDFAIFMLDAAGCVASWNQGAVRILGYSTEEILGRHVSCFHTPENVVARKPQRMIELAIAEGRYEEESPWLRKNGTVFWSLIVMTPLYENDAFQGMAIVARDISEQKHAEEKTRLMVELAVNAMILVDVNGTLVLANPQTEKLFGYSQAELIGQPVEKLVPESFRASHPLHRERFFANPCVRAMGAGRDLYARRKDGSEFPVEIGLNPIHTGEELLVLGSIVDITERKRGEDSARKHLAQLAHAGRLSTVGEMLSGLAHEINQPLAAAANYARACVRFAKSDESITKDQLRDWMEKAAAQAERASEIVKRLGAFMKKDRSIRSELNLNKLIENVIGLPGLLNSNTEQASPPAISLELVEGIPPIYADKVQIEQVVVNLIRNAIEAMDDTDPNQRRLTVKTLVQEGMIQVSVTDAGHGITPEHQARLFNPFFTTKPEGMGLGLSISRSIIEAHDGQMQVESVPGRGTTISFLLPFHRKDDSL